MQLLGGFYKGSKGVNWGGIRPEAFSVLAGFSNARCGFWTLELFRKSGVHIGSALSGVLPAMLETLLSTSETWMKGLLRAPQAPTQAATRQGPRGRNGNHPVSFSKNYFFEFLFK